MTPIFNASSPTGWNICTPPPFPPSGPLSLSPVQSNETLIGAWSHNHTSDVAIVYSESAVPTPWPIFLVGLLISLGGSVYSSTSGKPSTSGGFKPLLGLVLGIYQSIRATSAFIGIYLALARKGGNFVAPSALSCVMLSLISASVGKMESGDDSTAAALTVIITGIGASFGVLGLIIMTVIQLFRPHSTTYYGEWIVTGGNCPRAIGTLAEWKCFNQSYVGCGVDALVRSKTANTTVQSGYLTTFNPNNSGNDNHIYISEMIMAGLLVFPDTFFLILLAPLVFLIAGFFMGIFKLLLAAFECCKGTRHWPSTLPGAGLIQEVRGELAAKNTADSDRNKSTSLSMQEMIKITVPYTIVVFILIGFPLHYVGQTKSKSYIIQDSIGNLSSTALQYGNQTFDDGKPLWQSWTGDGVNASVWTDFFVAQTPANRFGFLHYWWNQNGAPIWHKIALM